MPQLPPEIAEAAQDPANTIGRYVRVRMLGSGGMGEVWKAYDTELGRWVALKFPKGEDPDELARFRREAQTAAKLAHPNIAAVYDHGEVAGRRFIAMQFIEGRSLDGALLPVRRAAEAMRDAAAAVHAAHDQGIVHRDLKPANLMMDATGRVFVLDFGLARVVRAQTQLSQSGMMIGTPSFMSPEQAYGDVKALDARTDVYGLGATFYALLTGRPPFVAGLMHEILVSVISDDPTPPRALRADVPAELEAIALKAMEKEPARRYASARAMADDLARWLAGEPVTARPPSTWRRIGRRLARRRGVVAAGVAAAAVATALVIALLLPSIRAERAEKERLEKLRPIETLMAETRPLFYVERIDMAGHLAKVEKAVDALERQARESDDPRLWAAAGRGWYFVGDGARAEQALRRAEERGSTDGAVAYTLGRIYLDRSRAALLLNTSTDEERHATIARAWNEKALACFERADRWEGAGPLDLYVAEVYRVLARDGRAAARELCVRGLARFGDAMGTEELWTLRAWCDTQAKDRAEAYDRAIARRPHYPWALFMRSTTRDAAGRLQDLEQAIRLNPRFADAYCNRGNHRLAAGDREGALADYSEAIRLDPDFALAWTNRALVRHEMGDYAGSLAEYDHALRLDPAFPPAWLGRATLHVTQHRYAEAIADYTRALERRPDWAVALSNRGVAREAAGDVAGALEDCGRAAELRPNDAGIQMRLGHVRLQAGDARGAVEAYAAAVKAEPTSAQTWFGRGLARQEAGDQSGAAGDFSEAIRLDPRHAKAFFYRGSARTAAGDADGAIADLTRAVELKPEYAEAWNNRGRVHQLQGRPADAAADYTAAINIRREATWLHNRGNAHLLLGRHDDAVADFDEAIRINPRLAAAYFGRGNARLEQGRFDDAIADYTAALAIEPKAAEVLAARGHARTYARDFAGAVADFERALEMSPRTWPHREMTERLLAEAKKRAGR